MGDEARVETRLAGDKTRAVSITNGCIVSSSA